MTDGVKIEHLVPFLVRAMNLGIPNRVLWATTYALNEEQIEALWTLALFERDKPEAELAALKQRPEADAA